MMATRKGSIGGGETGSPCIVRGSSRRPVKLQNVASGQTSVDTLHHRTSLEPIGCNEKVCVGSLMNWKHQSSSSSSGNSSCSVGGKKGVVRSREEVISAAKSFLDQYYSSIKRLNTPAHETRWKEVLNEITSSSAATGSATYELKETELIFGAKLAWRNAPRCIGRIQWSKLQVFDFRFVSTAREMFEAICNHIKYATNKGNLRSAITIFPQRNGDPRNDFRVWNAQLISYAGYADPDDPKVVLGDPINVEFTQLCEKLGWKGARTRFDILPLVLSANGQDPQLFVIPDDLIIRIKLSHPKYSWWADMGLEWYALPAVSGMMLDVGGIEFPAAPFSGWYMVTEIAMRDLCDTHRYNILEDVAKRMGLDTRSNASLWKDAAAVEVNISVLDSFQKAGVTIVDHHTASESFMKHLENEQRLRGGCPADWVWVVPPTSSSLTPVFHQEMLYYELKPSYEYQESPLKTHIWKSVPGSDGDVHGDSLMPIRKIRHFKEIAKAVKFTSNLFGKALSKRIKATILFATETGKSELYAKRLEQIFSHAFNVNVICMDSYDTFNLEHETLLLIVTSTFGNGDPPENGESFARQLQAIKVTRDTTPDIESIRNISMSYLRVSSVESLDGDGGLSANISVGQVGPLSNIRFSVFALGSSAYPNFCAFGRYIDNVLAELGGERITKLATGDELCGQEQAFNEWAKKVFQEAGDVFCIGDEVNMSEVINSDALRRTSWSASDIKLQPTNVKTNITQGLSKGSNRKVVEFQLKQVVPLYQYESIDTRQTIKVELEVINNDNTEFSYLPGDHLGLFAENDPLLIQKIEERLPKLNFGRHVQVLIKHIRQLGPREIEEWEPHERLPPTSLREALRRFLDITTPPTQQFLALLSCFCSDEEERGNLKVLSTESQKYEEWKAYHFPTFLEVLQLFPSLDPPAELILTQMPPLQPRFYSISSSPLFMAQQQLQGSANGDLDLFESPTPLIQLQSYLWIKSPPAPASSTPSLSSTPPNIPSSNVKSPKSDAANDFSRIDLTVAVVTYQTHSGKEHYGVCSNFLLKTATDDPDHTVYGFIRSAPNFRLPDREDVPVIMVGPGTGIAPFRAFWLQRYAAKSLYGHLKNFGPMTLFFGCRHPSMQLYKNEIQQMLFEGVIDTFYVAFSRDPNIPKKYVQDFMLQESESLYKQLVLQNGHFYVCGDVSMAEDVCKTLKTVLMENGVDDPDVAFISLRESMRFHEDIFGITLRTAEVTRKGRKDALSKRSLSASSS